MNQLIWGAANPTPGTKDITMTGTVTDNLSPIKTFTIDGTPVTLDPSGNYALDVTLNQGKNTFTTFAEDEAGNITEKNRHVFYGVDTSWVYDLHGNILVNHDILTNTLENFTHNSRNQLTQYDKIVNSIPTTTASYQYDPDGKRTQKTVNGTVTKYVYDKEDIILELDSLVTVVAKYVHGPGIDMPISMERSGETYYYHFDGLGSVTAITDSSGTLVQTYEYDAFGNILSEQDPNFENPYTYTSRERDKESNLYFYRGRYYDASIGRFLQPDPIWDVNLYPYVGNNPARYIDPWGLWSVSIDLVPGIGAGFTLGKDPCENWFFSSRFQVGLGGGFTIDPGSTPGPSGNTNAISDVDMFIQTGVDILGLVNVKGPGVHTGVTHNKPAGTAKSYDQIQGYGGTQYGIKMKPSIRIGVTGGYQGTIYF